MKDPWDTHISVYLVLNESPLVCLYGQNANFK